MTIQERASEYNKAFPQYPDSHFMISGRWVSATWITGNNYRGSGYYGSYPPGYIKRVYSMFPETGINILHLFSGSLTKGDVQKLSSYVFRINDQTVRGIQPEFQLNAETFFGDLPEKLKFRVGFADPPYSKEDATHYGVRLCNKKKVLGECHKVLEQHGLLFWMDTRIPMYSKKFWKMVGVISLYRSTNHRIRGVMIFERV